MIQKPEMSEYFTVEDIRKLRTYEAEMMKDMTRDEVIAYYKEAGERVKKAMAERRAEREREKIEE
jgi:hypothetical protein